MTIHADTGAGRANAQLPAHSRRQCPRFQNGLGYCRRCRDLHAAGERHRRAARRDVSRETAALICTGMIYGFLSEAA